MDYQKLLAEITTALDIAADQSQPPAKSILTKVQQLGKLSCKKSVRMEVDCPLVADLLKQSLKWIDKVYASQPELGAKRKKSIRDSLIKLTRGVAPKITERSFAEELRTLQQCATLVAASDGFLALEEQEKIGEIKPLARDILACKGTFLAYEESRDLDQSLQLGGMPEVRCLFGSDLFHDLVISFTLEELQQVELTELIARYAARVTDPFVQKVTAWACKDVVLANGEVTEGEHQALELLLQHWGFTLEELDEWVDDVLIPVIEEQAPGKGGLENLFSLFGVSSLDELMAAMADEQDEDEDDDDEEDSDATGEEQAPEDPNPVWNVIAKRQFDDLLTLKLEQAWLEETRDNFGVPGLTPLMLIANTGKLDHIKVLVTAGADVNAKIKDGPQSYSVLMFAVKSDDSERVAYLLKAGADVNPVSAAEAEFSPLTLAASRGQAGICKLLVDHGADPFWCDSNGSNAIKLTALNTDDEPGSEVITYLLTLGVDPHKPDNEGFFAIHNAIQDNKQQMLQALLTAGADPNQPLLDGSDDFPLTFACRKGKLAMVQMLIATGADPALCSKTGSFIPGDDDPLNSESMSLLDSAVFSCLRRTEGRYVETETLFIVKSLIDDYGAQPSLLSLCLALLFEKGEDLRVLLFKTAQKNLVTMLEEGQAEAIMNGIVGTWITVSEQLELDVSALVLHKFRRLLDDPLNYDNATVLQTIDEIISSLEQQAAELRDSDEDSDD